MNTGNCESLDHGLRGRPYCQRPLWQFLRLAESPLRQVTTTKFALTGTANANSPCVIGLNRLKGGAQSIRDRQGGAGAATIKPHPLR